MMRLLESDLAGLLWSPLLRSTGLFLLVWAGCGLFRRQSAQLRHLAWLAVLLSLLDGN